MHTGINRPTLTRSIFNGEVRIHGFGIQKDQPEYSWTFEGMARSQDLSLTHSHMVGALSQFPMLHNIYAPSQKANSAIVSTHHFRHPEKQVVHLTEGKYLYQGPEAEGVSDLRSGDGFAMTAGDCALIVVKRKKKILAAHAGRDSLLDKGLLTRGTPTKLHVSIVDTIMNELAPAGEARDKVEVYIGFAIKGKHFSHPVYHPNYGEINRRMIDWIDKKYVRAEERSKLGVDFCREGRIDLRWLIGRQFEMHGVLWDNIYIDEVCTYSDMDNEGNHTWHSNRRSPGKHNLIIAERVS